MDHNSDHETTAGSAAAVATTVNRRPMNAFLLFCKRHRGIVKERYPTLENRNITKILGEWWQSLSDDDKSTFTALANEYKEHVVREMPQSNATATGAKLSNIKEQTQTGAVVLVTNGGSGCGGASNTLGSASSSPEPPPPPPPPPAQPPPPTQPPNHRYSAEASRGPVSASEEGAKNSVVNSSSSNSGASSSASSIVSLSSSSSSAAPKPFKKRYLANFDTASLAAAAAAATVSPEAEHACKALLQLAGVRESSPTTLGASTATSSPATAAASSFSSSSTWPTATASLPPPPQAAVDSAANGPNCESAKLELKSEGSGSRNESSRSGTTSPPESMSATEKERGKLTANGFRTLRDAVWSRVAKTLLKQEEEKGMLNHAGAGNDDGPLNLSSQCTIRGQTIIEHIIENCMQAKPNNMASGGNGDKGGGDADASRSASAAGNAILVNMNNNGVSGCGGGDGGGTAPSPQDAEAAGAASGAGGADSPFSAEEIKERIYEGLKQDLLSKRSGEKRDSKEAAALWNMLPQFKIAQERAEGKIVGADPKPVAEPAGSNLTKSEDDDDGSKLSIKHLLAQSPAPLSPRSRSGNSSSKSSAAVSPNAAASASATTAVSVTLVSNDVSGGSSGQQPVNLSTTPPQTPSTTTSVVTISTLSAAAATAAATAAAGPRAASIATTSKRSLSSADGGETSAAASQQGTAAKRKLLGGGSDAAAPTAEEEEESVRRSSRSCKGRLYQEFKDEGRLGRSKSGSAGGSLVVDRSALTSMRKAHKSGDSSTVTLTSADVAMNRKDQNTHSLNHNVNPPSPFDITAKLNAIPALSLDSYQQKLLKAKNGGSEESSTRNARPTSSHQQQQQQPQPQARRRSGDNIESTPPKRKSRRTATAAAAAATIGQAAPAVSPTPTVKKDAKEEQQLMTNVDVVVSS